MLKLFSLLSYIGPLFIAGLIYYNLKNKNKSLKFHINQGFMLLLLEIFLIIVYFFLKAIPYAGAFISQLYAFIAAAMCLVCISLGIIHVIMSAEQPIPYVGKFIVRKK